MISASTVEAVSKQRNAEQLKDPVYEKHGVIHFSAWNLPSRVARTASIAFSNIFSPLLQNLADSGGYHTSSKE